MPDTAEPNVLNFAKSISLLVHALRSLSISSARLAASSALTQPSPTGLPSTRANKVAETDWAGKGSSACSELRPHSSSSTLITYEVMNVDCDRLILRPLFEKVNIRRFGSDLTVLEVDQSGRKWCTWEGLTSPEEESERMITCCIWRRFEPSIVRIEVGNIGFDCFRDAVCGRIPDADVRMLDLGSSLYCRIPDVANCCQDSIKSYYSSARCNVSKDCSNRHDHSIFLNETSNCVVKSQSLDC